MKKWFLRCPKRHVWLFSMVGLILLFELCRGSRGLMNGLAVSVTGPFKRAVGTLCGAVPFSVAELLIASAVGLLALYLACTVGDLLRTQHRAALLYRRGVGLACAVLSVYAGFCLLWGVNYQTDSFQDRSGIRAQPIAVEPLTEVTERFAMEANRLCGAVTRDEAGRFSVPRQEILDKAPGIYRGIEAEFPFLEKEDVPPKAAAFSKTMSLVNFTGYFFPFTGEANLNVDSPACFLPATIAHEMAHQRDISSEQECNFIAVLTCEKSGDPVYQYSGALMAYVHLGNALYRADPAAWERIRGSLDERVLLDLAENNAYWRQYRDKTVHKVSKKAYDGFLKGYGEEQGIRSYGAVVDLLVAYYGKG